MHGWWEGICEGRQEGRVHAWAVGRQEGVRVCMYGRWWAGGVHAWVAGRCLPMHAPHPPHTHPTHHACTLPTLHASFPPCMCAFMGGTWAGGWAWSGNKTKQKIM